MRNRITGLILLLLIIGGGSIFITCCKKDNNSILTDIDGNTYQSITIGTQVWMVENLKTTRYNNGEPIKEIIDKTEWSNSSEGGFCYYDNNSQNISTYGVLYNWYAINDNRKIAPTGWHIASKSDWDTLIDYLGGSDVAGGKIKEIGITHWKSPNFEASNEVGFTALPGGLRYKDGLFMYISTDAYWWLPEEYDPLYSWFSVVTNVGKSIGIKQFGAKQSGLSVRCVKD